MPIPIVTREIDSPVGPLLAGACARGVCLLEFGSPERQSRALRDLDSLLDSTEGASDDPQMYLERLVAELDAFFAGTLAEFGVRLCDPGTEFQRSVWARMRAIPCGQTLSYGQLADEIGSPGGARAVGAASGHNRIAILIPCHRVVESTGALRGYGGGLDTKRWLLDHEQAITGQGVLFEPSR